MGARRKGWAAVLLAGATGLSGVGSVLWFTALPAAAFTAPVKVVGRAFDPQTTRIEVGDKVLWRNLTDERHSVTSDSGSTRFDYTLGRKNAQEERRFETAGTYTYHCKFHPEMTGTVEVVDPSAPTTTPSTAPPTTATTAPSTTTTTPTTAPPPPSTTATTAPPTTTTTGRPPAAVPLPPVPNSAAAPPPTRATSSTTTLPSSTTTTVPPTTATSAAPPVTGEAAPPPSSAPTPPPPTEPAPDTGDEIPTAAGPASAAGDKLDAASVTLISLLVAVGLFGAWTLIRIRPGRI